MRQFTTTVLASLASLAVIGAAQAQTYLGHSASAGTLTSIPAANDVPSLADLQTLFLRVTDTAGTVVALPLIVSGGTVGATYTSGGATTTITLTPMSPTQTRVKIAQSTPAGGRGLRRVELGTVNSRAGFDIVNGAVRTVGSGLGLAPAVGALVGPTPWVAKILFSNTVAITGTAPQGDLYKTMLVDITTPMFNGAFEFFVDTDRLY